MEDIRSLIHPYPATCICFIMTVKVTLGLDRSKNQCIDVPFSQMSGKCLTAAAEALRSACSLDPLAPGC